MPAPNRKLLLRRLDLLFVRSPIYFVTACTENRRRLLATAAIHETFLRFGQEGPAHGAWIGVYVIMPDHFHLFVATDDEKMALAAWMKCLKNTISKALRSTGVASSHWQKHFSTTCSGVVSRTHESGTTFARTRCGLDLQEKLKTGRIPVRSSRWNIARGINVRRSQTVATEMIIRDASEPNLPAIVDIYNAAIATHGSGTL